MSTTINPNHTALSQAIKVYTDAMRRLIKEKLVAAYPTAWWNQGVLKNLTPDQKQRITRDLNRLRDADQSEVLEPSYFWSIIGRNFNGAFGGVFTNYNRTRAFMDQVTDARNTADAHSRSGDLLADDVANSLYVVHQLLAEAKLPEAEQVEQLRQQVLHRDAPVAPTVAVARPSTAGATATARVEQRQTASARLPTARPAGAPPYWWEVCEPHPAFQNPANIDEGLFAATLGAVHAGAARAEYLDPATFFSHTYFTTNLAQTVCDVVSRLNGGEGASATELQTPFGGGKTHALLTLYHLIKTPSVAMQQAPVRDVLGSLSLPADARVMVFDGQEWGTEPIPKEDGTVVQSLWGDLAYQADPRLFHDYVSGSDNTGVAPGNETYRRVLQAASPCVILIDELVSYLVKLKFASPQRLKNLYRQTVQFIQDLLQESGNVRGVCVLLSLPQSRTEFGGLDPDELQAQLGVIPDLRARADRVVAKRTPVNDDEIYTLMSRRLFKQHDDNVARQAAQAYRDLYDKNTDSYSEGVRSPEYFERPVAAYPLHPELIDVLYKKWSTASGFPRTRAVLQLLASIVADQWQARPEAFTIQPSHVNLERERIRTRIVSAANDSGYDAVVAADIVGGDAHADGIDQRRGAEWERLHIARGIATTLLMHSFGGATRLGALPPDLRLGAVAPNVGPEYVGEVVGALEQSLWYVHRDGELLRFQTRPNVYRVISQKAEQQPAPLVRDLLIQTLTKAIGSAVNFRVLDWSATEGAIDNRPDPTIAVLPERFAVSSDDGRTVQGRAEIDRAWERHGGGFREFRNSLILVAPDRELWARVEDATREVLGYRSVLADIDRGNFEVSAAELRELKTRLRDKEDSLRTSLVTAYRWVFVPEESGLDVVALPSAATRDEQIASRIVKRLSDSSYGNPKIIERMSAVFFGAKILPNIWKNDAEALDLAETARNFTRRTFLPILPSREPTLAACVREGVEQGQWAIALGDLGAMKFTRLVEKVGDLDTVPNLFDGSAGLIRGGLLDMVREEIAAAKPAEPIVQPPNPPVGPGPGLPPVDPPIQPPPVIQPPVIPKPTRLGRLRLHLDDLSVGKTNNLQPYLFRVLQGQDAAAKLSITIEVSSDAGISAETVEKQIVEGLEQLNIGVTWEPT